MFLCKEFSVIYFSQSVRCDTRILPSALDIQLASGDNSRFQPQSQSEWHKNADFTVY